MKLLITFFCLLLGTIVVENLSADASIFIDEMVEKHQFDKNELDNVFAEVEVKNSILTAISRPAEKTKPWYVYRRFFLTPRHINGGVDFWQTYEQALTDAEQEYGVPAEIIIAILGVETRYGGNVGSYRVIDALYTLAFHYPRRSKFFRSELEHFLILARQENLSPLKPLGSYAGAMGLGQFMPSSYLHYAVDFDGDGKRDIWTNPVDAIGSVANYLYKYGWQRDQTIVHRTEVALALPEQFSNSGLKPSFSREQLSEAGLSLAELPEGDDKLSFISLTQQDGEEYWLGRQNFYVITRYNHSRMYAMAVIQLAQEIRHKMEKQ